MQHGRRRSKPPDLTAVLALVAGWLLVTTLALVLLHSCTPTTVS